MTSLKVNDKAPEFKAQDHEGNTISSKDFDGKKYAVYFYPKDNTPACTVQACNLRDNYAALAEKKISIIGVSMDTEKMHQKFVAKHELPFPLIPDTDKKLIEAFNVWGLKKFMGREFLGVIRSTFLIDPAGRIAHIWRSVHVKGHVIEVLKKLRELQGKPF